MTFEEKLNAIPFEAALMRGAVIDVLDTAELVAAWARDRGVSLGDHGLAALTDLILRREEAARRFDEAQP